MKNLKSQCFFVAPALGPFLRPWLRRFIIDTPINSQYFYCQASTRDTFHIIKYRTFVLVIVVAWVTDHQNKNSSALSIYCITPGSPVGNHHLNPSAGNLVVILIYCIASELSAGNHHLNPPGGNPVVNRIPFCPQTTFSHSLLLYVYNMP